MSHACHVTLQAVFLQRYTLSLDNAMHKYIAYIALWLVQQSNAAYYCFLVGEVLKRSYTTFFVFFLPITMCMWHGLLIQVYEETLLFPGQSCSLQL